MASWKDGAAYAPLERPDGFATPTADPLTGAPPWSAGTPGPIAPPGSFDAPTDAKPLDSGAPQAAAERDPREPFEVASSVVTARPGARKRDPRQPIATSASPVVPPPPPPATQPPPPAPPSGPPLPQPAPPRPPVGPGAVPHQDPRQQPPPTAARNAGPWGPPAASYPPPPPAPVPVDQSSRQLVLLASGLSFIGFLLATAAPFLLVVAGALGLRSTPKARLIGRWALGAGLAFTVVQLLTDTLGGGSLLIQLVSLAVAIGFLVVANRRI